MATARRWPWLNSDVLPAPIASTGGLRPFADIIDTPVGAVVQSTRQGVGRQIATMVHRLIAGEDLTSLQVLWQPEFIPGETA